MQVLLQAKHVALPFYSLQTRCLSHPIVLSRLSRPCELNDRFRLCRPRRYLLCAHQFAADSVRVDGGRLAHPKARARPVVKDSFQTVFGMFIRPHREKSGIGKENYPRICDRLPRARILTHLTRFRLRITCTPPCTARNTMVLLQVTPRPPGPITRDVTRLSHHSRMRMYTTPSKRVSSQRFSRLSSEHLC